MSIWNFIMFIILLGDMIIKSKVTGISHDWSMSRLWIVFPIVIFTKERMLQGCYLFCSVCPHRRCFIFVYFIDCQTPVWFLIFTNPCMCMLGPIRFLLLYLSMTRYSNYTTPNSTLGRYWCKYLACYLTGRFVKIYCFNVVFTRDGGWGEKNTLVHRRFS